MTFDRLVYIDRLKEAGVDATTARAHAGALRDALLETVATKSDLKEAASALNHDLKDAISALDRKIEITARDLTIKWAGGLVIIASLIAAPKLFG